MLLVYGLIQEMARASEKCWLNTSTTTICMQYIRVSNMLTVKHRLQAYRKYVKVSQSFELCRPVRLHTYVIVKFG